MLLMVLTHLMNPSDTYNFHHNSYERMQKIVSKQLNQKDLELMLISKFKLVLPSPPVIKFSCAELRITPTKFIFNKVTIAELGYPENICFLLSEDNTKLVVKAAAENEFTVRFCTYDDDRNLISKMPISIGNKAFSQSLRNFFDWDSKKTYVIPAIKYTDARILLFDLSKAYIRKKGERGIQRSNENLLNSYPKMSDIVSNYHQLSISTHTDVTVEE